MSELLLPLMLWAESSPARTVREHWYHLFVPSELYDGGEPEIHWQQCHIDSEE